MEEDRFIFTAGCKECCKTIDFDIPNTWTVSELRRAIEYQHKANSPNCKSFYAQLELR